MHPLTFTAVYLKAKHGYVGYIEEIPLVNSHGLTLEEARSTLQELAALVFDDERRNSRERTTGKDVVREPFVVREEKRGQDPFSKATTKKGPDPFSRSTG